MNRKYVLKVVVVIIVVLALVLPGSAIFANIEKPINNEISSSDVEISNNIDNLRTLDGATIDNSIEEISGSDVDWWPMFHHDLNHSGYSTSEAPDTCSILWRYDIGNQIVGSPAVVDDKIFIVSTNDDLYCLDAMDGSFIWNRTIGHSYYSAPAIIDGRVYAGSREYSGNEYTIHCMDASDGSVIWNYATDDNIFSSPAVADGRVFIGSQDKNLYCLDAMDGSLIWNYTTGHSGQSSPAVADGRVFFGSSDDNVYCLNESDGSLIWNYTTDDRAGGSSPAVVNGKVFIGSADHNVYCLNAMDGSLIWKSDIDYGGRSSPAIAYGKVFIGSGDNNIYCLDASDGSFIWNYTTSGFVTSSPAVADGKVFVGCNQQGNLYCLDAMDGSLIWKYDTNGHAVCSSPAIADGNVYIGSDDGNVYCFGPPHAHDVGVASINSPVSGPVGVFTPDVTVRNFGLNDETAVPVSMFISKNLINEYNETINIDIDYGESKTVTFPDWTPDNLNSGVYGDVDYTVTACTQLVIDENPGNDCKTETITLDYGFDWWPMFRHDISHRGYSTSTAPDNNTVLWNYTTGTIIGSSPAVVDDHVYIGSNANNNVYCLNANTGDHIWDYTTGGRIRESSPAVADGKVYIGSQDHKVYCLNAITGDYIWSYTTGYEIVSSPAVADGKVYIGSEDHKVYCLNADTGDLIWNYTTGGRIYWSSPAIVDGKVYIGSSDYNVYCLNADTGDLIWNYITGGWIMSSPSVVDGKVYVGSHDRKIYCLDADTGDLIWSYNTIINVISSSPAVVDDKVYIGADIRLCCLNADTGDLIWNYTTGIASSPAIADGKVYVGARSKKVFCLNADTGDHIWNYTTGDYIHSSPAIADGKIFIGSNDGNLYCFGTLPPDTTPPVTTHEFDPSTPNGDNNWYVTDVTITLTATDDISGVDVTYYRIDSGAWDEYDDPVVVSDDGEHTLEYYSIDNAGNIEDVKGPFDFKIDQTPPETTCDLDGIMEGGVYITDVTVTLTATDDMSGVAETFYRLNDGEWEEYSAFVVSEDGEHTISFYSIDNAGNTEDQKTESFTIQHPCPIEIEISGGLGVNAVITNTGEEDITDLEWSINITGGLLGLIDKETNGTIPIFAIDEEVTVKSGIFIGLGSISITVTAGCAEETINGKQFIIFTKVG